MNEFATNLVAAGTNAVAPGTNVAFSSTDAIEAGTNAVSALADTANATVGHHCCLFSSNSFTVLLLMASGVFLGGVGSFCYQRYTHSSEKSRDKWDLVKILGMGIAAVALVPAFLRTVSSNLIKEMETSFEAKLVFVAFCVAATLAAKKFIGTIPDKLLNLANEAKDQAAAAETETAKLAKVMAERLPQPEAVRLSRETKVASGKTAYDPKTEDVIRALLNPKYAQGRTVPGLAFDAGWTVPEIQEALLKLQKNGDVEVFVGNPTKGPLWYLTRAARQKFAGLIQNSGVQMDESGIQ